MQNLTSFYINGEWVTTHSNTMLEAINPSNEQVYANLAAGTIIDANKAIMAAKEAFPNWAQTNPAERLNYIKKILNIYNSKVQELAKAISIEMGAPIDFALNSQVASGKRNIENFIEAFKDFKFERPLTNNSEAKLFLTPIGVVTLITPWNWPINQITKKVIPALLAGCTMVLKPSELSPLSANIFAQICHEAGLPKGVFNMVHGTGYEIGHALTNHPDVAMVSFTGSTRAGKEITKAAADSLKHVTLELGGKGANIIFEDCDAQAIERGVLRCFSNSGQSCNSPTRMLVQKSIYKQAVEQAKNIAQNILVDIASKPGSHIGPVVSKAQFEKIQELIQSGINEGANLIIGGPGKPTNLEMGYFIKPTIFSDVTSNMRIFKEEIFGPVLSIIPFEDEQEALKLANDTIYGLTNYVQSQNYERCLYMAKNLESGMVELNGNNLPNGSFFGGIKQSGKAREGGKWGIEEFLNSKAVTI